VGRAVGAVRDLNGAAIRDHPGRITSAGTRSENIELYHELRIPSFFFRNDAYSFTMLFIFWFDA